MAAAFAKAAEDELSCPICLELFVAQFIPKDLPGCDHTVCKVCLKNLTKDMKGDTRIIICPECRKESKIPKDGVNALKTNRKVRNLAEKHPRDAGSGSVRGEVNLKDMKEETTPHKDIKSKAPMCPDHDQERMHYYCTVCNCLACLACLILKHPGHAIEGVKDRYQVKHRAMKVQLKEAESKVAKCSTDLGFIRELEQQNQQRNSSERRRIERKLEELREVQQNIHDEVLECEQHVQTIESIYNVASTAHANASECEYLMQHSSLCEQLGKITVKQLSVPVRRTFKSQRREDLDVKSKCKQSPTKLTLMQTINTSFEMATCGASNIIHWSQSGLLAFLHKPARQVAIYRKRNNEYKLHLIWKLHPCWSLISTTFMTLDEMAKEHSPITQLGGISFGPQDDVYVAVCDHVQVYTLKGQLIDQFPMGVINGLTSVNVTKEGLMLVGYAGQFDNNAILVTDRASRKILRIIDAIAPPNCTTLIEGGMVTQIAISGDVDGVSVMQTDIPRKTHRVEGMDNVTGICYHERTRSLLAITSKNGSRIDQYSCTSGEKLACLLEGVDGMWDLDVSTDGILAVVNGKRNVIELFQTE